MFDVRPVGYLVGLMVLAVGATMLLPLAVDLVEGRGHWPVFAESMIFTCLTGGLVALSCRNAVGRGSASSRPFS